MPRVNVPSMTDNGQSYIIKALQVLLWLIVLVLSCQLLVELRDAGHIRTGRCVGLIAVNVLGYPIVHWWSRKKKKEDSDGAR